MNNFVQLLNIVLEKQFLMIKNKFNILLLPPYIINILKLNSIIKK